MSFTLIADNGKSTKRGVVETLADVAEFQTHIDKADEGKRIHIEAEDCGMREKDDYVTEWRPSVSCHMSEAHGSIDVTEFAAMVFESMNCDARDRELLS